MQVVNSTGFHQCGLAPKSFSYTQAITRYEQCEKRRKKVSIQQKHSQSFKIKQSELLCFWSHKLQRQTQLNLYTNHELSTSNLISNQHYTLWYWEEKRSYYVYIASVRWAFVLLFQLQQAYLSWVRNSWFTSITWGTNSSSSYSGNQIKADPS